MPATVPYDMSTPNRGKIWAAERAELRGKHGTPHGTPGGLTAANVFEQPAEWVTGPHGGKVGGTDPCNDGFSE
jgi:hypothetical protein